ncbi:sperm acrosome membrane-associated protein 4 [Kryptolebias marmoratus]|uniref:sperm acrosome membrane-associated protein 4 n=1 Tax=Kryptolebias marmoratus TaxID=37003 RepID=UPI0007F86D52|nr:sperm acrosome membrane-associated protein 4 [Kryptolebias marmoratus]
MGKLVFVALAAFASLVAVESVICNKCTVSLFGFCLNGSNVTCNANTSVCFTGKATFPSITSFGGFTNQGCLDVPTGCNTTTNGTLLGVTYQTTLTCCSTDRCNPVTITSDAPATKMAFSAAAGVAILASVWGSML